MFSFFSPRSSLQYTDLALLILRVGMSFFLAHHGFEKLQNYLNGSRDFPDPIFLGPNISFLLTIFAEFFCAIAVALGLFTRFASAVLVILFVIICFVLHLSEPLSEKEHALMYLFTYLAILLTGAGRYSLDHKLFQRQ
ncbi:MAG: DoxX family protein [Runella sp.]